MTWSSASHQRSSARPGVETAQALVGRVEHGGEDGVVEGELVIVILRGGTARARASLVSDAR